MTAARLRGTPSTEAPDQAEGSQTVYERLVDLIVTLELEPGSVVTETALLQRLKTGRSSIREAVVRLIDTGLATVIPRTGIAIAPVRLLDVQNVYEARSVIETTLARLAAERSRPDRVAAFVALAGSLEPDASPMDFLAFDRRFHAAMGDLASNELLSRSLRSVLLTSSRVWALYFRLNGAGHHAIDGTAPERYQSHGAIVEAIAARDPDAAQLAIERYLEESRARLSSVFWPQGGP